MKTDEELAEHLRKASREVRPPDDPLGRLHRRHVTKRRSERLVAGALALVLFAAAVGGSLFALRGVLNGSRHRSGSGDGALSVPSNHDLALGPGEYFYLSTQIVLVPHGKVLIQTWWATDGSGRIEVVEYEDAQYGLPPVGTFGPGAFPIESDISDLSADPAVLYDQIRDRSEPGGASPQPDVTPGGPGQTKETGRMWRAVKRLLEYPHALPELRAALIKVAQEIPGVKILHDVDGLPGAGESVGRPADGVQLTIEGMKDTIAYDPGTLQPYEIASVPPEDPSNGWHEVFSEGIVDSPGDVPSGDQWLMPNPI